MTSWVEDHGSIEAISPVDATVIRLDIRAPGVTRSIRPGQFVMLRPTESPWLPRAMAPVNWNKTQGVLSFYVRILGPGTQFFRHLTPGASVLVTGPLGQPILLDHGPWALIGRGVGATPLLPIAQVLAQQGEEVRTYLSARTRNLVIEPHAFESSGSVYLHTDATHLGGLVTDSFVAHLQAGWRPRQVLVSGSHRLRQVVWEQSHRWSFHAAVFVEEKMACGLGWCKGCAIGRHWQLLCIEGPTLSLDEVMSS